MRWPRSQVGELRGHRRDSSDGQQTGAAARDRFSAASAQALALSESDHVLFDLRALLGGAPGVWLGAGAFLVGWRARIRPDHRGSHPSLRRRSSLWVTLRAARVWSARGFFGPFRSTARAPTFGLRRLALSYGFGVTPRWRSPWPTAVLYLSRPGCRGHGLRALVVGLSLCATAGVTCAGHRLYLDRVGPVVAESFIFVVPIAVVTWPALPGAWGLLAASRLCHRCARARRVRHGAFRLGRCSGGDIADIVISPSLSPYRSHRRKNISVQGEQVLFVSPLPFLFSTGSLHRRQSSVWPALHQET